MLDFGPERNVFNQRVFGRWQTNIQRGLLAKPLKQYFLAIGWNYRASLIRGGLSIIFDVVFDVIHETIIFSQSKSACGWTNFCTSWDGDPLCWDMPTNCSEGDCSLPGSACPQAPFELNGHPLQMRAYESALFIPNRSGASAWRRRLWLVTSYARICVQPFLGSRRF